MSQPPMIAARAAAAMRAGSARRPVSRMTFRVASGAAFLQAWTSSVTSPMSPSRIAWIGATTSTSSAPAASASAVSRAARARSSDPSGKLATVASRIGLRSSLALASGTNRGHTQTAATPASMARAHRVSIWASVSPSARDVRSTSGRMRAAAAASPGALAGTLEQIRRGRGHRGRAPRAGLTAGVAGGRPPGRPRPAFLRGSTRGRRGRRRDWSRSRNR